MKILLCTNVCYGSVRPYSIVSCQKPYQTIDNMAKASHTFDLTFMIDDYHFKDDKEFDYIPEHMLANSQDCMRLAEWNKDFNKFQFLQKNTLSAVFSEHNRKTVLGYNPDSITLAGFTASFDIIATALNLIDLKQNVSLLRSCISDVTEDHKNKALNYLSYMGIRSLD